MASPSLSCHWLCVSIATSSSQLSLAQVTKDQLPVHTKRNVSMASFVCVKMCFSKRPSDMDATRGAVTL